MSIYLETLCWKEILPQFNCMFRNFYLPVLRSLLAKVAANTFPNSTMKYKEKVWHLFKVINEDTRECQSGRSVQLYLNLFQHLSFHSLFHLVHGEVHDETNTCTS